jgi:hypothetical protein
VVALEIKLAAAWKNTENFFGNAPDQQRRPLLLRE